MELAALLIPTAVLVYMLWRADRRYDKAQALIVAIQDEWTAERDKARQRHDDERASLLADLKAERSEWATERAQLLNRIQRPDTAVYENFEPSETKQYAGFDDDAEVWDALNGNNGEPDGNR